MKNTELQLAVSKMLNTRATTWEASEYIDLLRYASVHLSLSGQTLATVNEMVQEYFDHLDRWKPTQWSITAGRIRALYLIAKKLNAPTSEDILYIINNLKNSEAFRAVSGNPIFLSGIRLLEYLYTNLDRMAYNKTNNLSGGDDDEP